MMNKDNSFEKAFTSAANDSTSGDGRAKRVSGKIIYFADIEKEFSDNPEAGEELRDKMEDVMRAIDHDPTSFDAIIAFGASPIADLGKVAKEVLNIQSKFDEQVKVMDIATDSMNRGIAEMGLDKLVSGVKKIGTGLGTAAVATGSGLSNLTKKVWGAITGGTKKRTEEEEQIHQMLKSLPDMYMQMQALALDMREAETGVKGVMQAADKLGKARLASVRELNVYLGACPEIERRYDEIYIKQAQEEFERSKDPEDELYLTSVIKGKENFQRQYHLLELSRGQGLGSGQQLHMLIEQMETQRRIIQQSRTFRENEWLALLSGAGFAGSSLKLAELIKKNDEAGDQMHRLTMDMMEKAHDMTLNSEGRGTIDPQLLIDSLQKMQKMVEKENEKREQRSRELDAVRRQVRAESDKLIDAVETAKQARILDAAPERAPEEIEPEEVQEEAQQATEQAEKPAVAINDNAPAAAPQASASRKNKKAGGSQPRPKQ